MEPFVIVLIGKFAVGKTLSAGFAQLKRCLTFPFQNALNRARKEKKNWTGAFDDIELWWNEGNLSGALEESSSASLHELADVLSQRFEHRTSRRHLASTTKEVFVYFLKEWRIEVDKKFPDIAQRRSMEKELQQDIAISEIATGINSARDEMRRISADALHWQIWPQS